MGELQRGDEELHYPDGSHRWMCPNPEQGQDGQDVWSQRVHEHMEEHRRLLASPSSTPTWPGYNDRPRTRAKVSDTSTDSTRQSQED